MKKFLLSASALLLLAGCVSQDQADEKMAKGCQAGVQALLKSAQIKEVKSTNYSFENNDEGQHRRVTLETVTKDGWMEGDKTYSCLFAQQWGLFKSSHTAVLVQLKMADGKVVGKQDGNIVGDIEDFMALAETVQDAMNK